ncbi:MAG: hypothetical protein IPK53_14115 [bacterium]|nr:hypothetical protein [bacterium]MBK8129984.1 hypothetical protein [bacterium]
MNRILVLVALLAALTSATMADDHALVKPAADDVLLGTLHVMNNVVEVKDGHSLAHCACGANFEVTDKSPHVELEGGTYFLCGEQCLSTVGSMDDAAKKSAIGSLQKAMVTEQHMHSNMQLKDGKKVGTCACQGEFEVGSATPMVLENGMLMGACCDGCASHVAKAKPEERAAMMQKVMVKVSEVKN